MTEIEEPEVDYEAANAALTKQMDDLIRRVYYSNSGGITACEVFEGQNYRQAHCLRLG